MKILANASDNLIRFLLFQSLLAQLDGDEAKSDIISDHVFSNVSEEKLETMIEHVNWVADNANKETYLQLAEETKGERAIMAALVFERLVNSLPDSNFSAN
jgi:hypothetical protein